MAVQLCLHSGVAMTWKSDKWSYCGLSLVSQRVTMTSGKGMGKKGGVVDAKFKILIAVMLSPALRLEM